MITDARVLQPEFIPREVQHRDAEVNYLSSVLRPLTKGERADPALLYGPSGAGKTCIAQFLVEQLRGEVVDLNYQYVNCWEDHSRFQTLYRLLDGIGKTVDIHRQSTPTDVLLERLRAADDTPYVIVLDEVDHAVQEWYSASGVDVQEGFEGYGQMTSNLEYQKSGYKITDRNTYTFVHDEDAEMRALLSVETGNTKDTFLGVGGVIPNEDEFGQGVDRIGFDVPQLQSRLNSLMKETTVTA